MLSESHKEVQALIEDKLTGLDKDDALLFHISVERKLASTDLWLQNVVELLPDFIQSSSTSGSDNRTESGIDRFLFKTSAYIDAFFMSAKSALDCFGHEIRSIYGLGGHSGDLYFENVLDLLPVHHNQCNITTYFVAQNIRCSGWYSELKAYRKASTHESIIRIEPSLNIDYLTGQWKTILLKLPLDPTQRPFLYNGKNFIDTGNMIKSSLYKFIIVSFDNMLADVKSSLTRIPFK
jgi:hypothetical protein